VTRLVRFLRRRDGYTLTELLVVMAIFMTVVTALTSLFTSGAKAELDLNRRFEAQHNARLALDKLRRELHCSDGITQVDGTPLPAPPATVTAIKVSLPSHCPSAQGVNITVVYEAVAVAPSRWELRRASVRVADYLTNDDLFAYYAQSASTRARLHVELPVNVYPNEGWKAWALADDIVLRNTLREDP
jgi:prepilin-type N-terminal cleavage/methylation domain-containing protein